MYTYTVCVPGASECGGITGGSVVFAKNKVAHWNRRTMPETSPRLANIRDGYNITDHDRPTCHRHVESLNAWAVGPWATQCNASVLECRDQVCHNASVYLDGDQADYMLCTWVRWPGSSFLLSQFDNSWSYYHTKHKTFRRYRRPGRIASNVNSCWLQKYTITEMACDQSDSDVGNWTLVTMQKIQYTLKRPTECDPP